jgi:hypothetical protein
LPASTSFRHGDGVAAVHLGVDTVVHHDRRRLVAAAEAGDVADRNVLLAGTLKGGVESRPDLVASAKVAAHVGAHAHVYLRGRAEMEVRIEAGYGMNLTYRYIDAGGECLEPVGRQITEISLYGPQFFKHDSGHSAEDLGEIKPYIRSKSANATAKRISCLHWTEI